MGAKKSHGPLNLSSNLRDPGVTNGLGNLPIMNYTMVQCRVYGSSLHLATIKPMLCWGTNADPFGFRV